MICRCPHWRQAKPLTRGDATVVAVFVCDCVSGVTNPTSNSVAKITKKQLSQQRADERNTLRTTPDRTKIELSPPLKRHRRSKANGLECGRQGYTTCHSPRDSRDSQLHERQNDIFHFRCTRIEVAFIGIVHTRDRPRYQRDRKQIVRIAEKT